MSPLASLLVACFGTGSGIASIPSDQDISALQSKDVLAAASHLLRSYREFASLHPC